ncbi:hypothetical protein AVEN_34576-1 [Araneus ventricosus]|uniref:Uncharacterized protein n=1 Tax=Araneus ventricosus TaxID=182803 RepID=A0A4Y2B1Q3_ARAVE|nr:hypothetical protein AVEN_34576-1 [Araneus ventricosus]
MRLRGYDVLPSRHVVPSMRLRWFDVLPFVAIENSMVTLHPEACVKKLSSKKKGGQDHPKTLPSRKSSSPVQDSILVGGCGHRKFEDLHHGTPSIPRESSPLRNVYAPNRQGISGLMRGSTPDVTVQPKDHQTLSVLLYREYTAHQPAPRQLPGFTLPAVSRRQ